MIRLTNPIPNDEDFNDLEISDPQSPKKGVWRFFIACTSEWGSDLNKLEPYFTTEDEALAFRIALIGLLRKAGWKETT